MLTFVNRQPQERQQDLLIYCFIDLLFYLFKKEDGSPDPFSSIFTLL
ncbi:hypothetical protein ES703_95038 [subsurface metagenome]